MGEITAMREYVLGFRLDPGWGSVVLIRKTHPEWQAGKLNGIGGKVEVGESPQEAMSREMDEEAGIVIPASDWLHFADISPWRDGPGTAQPKAGLWVVRCFVSDYNYDAPSADSQNNPERPWVYDVEDILSGQHCTLSNVPWLLAMALERIQAGAVPERTPHLVREGWGDWEGST